MSIQSGAGGRLMRLSACGIAVINLALAAPAVPMTQEPPRVAPRKLKDHRGQIVTVCGKVVTHECADDKDRATVLDLDKPYWSKPPAILVPESVRARFPVRLEDRYAFGKVCATGVVERRDRRDMVRVDEPANIMVDEEPAPITVPPDTRRPCDVGVKLPTVIREVKPSYTPEAMRGVQQGLVLVEALVMTDGVVAGARVVYGLEPRLGLEEEAVKAVRRWLFKPGTLDGRPIPIIVTVEMTFRLK